MDRPDQRKAAQGKESRFHGQWRDSRAGANAEKLPPSRAWFATWWANFDQPDGTEGKHYAVTQDLWGASPLAKSGTGDEVVMSMTGHVSRAMLSRYSYVRVEAKRRALNEVATRQRGADEKREKEALRQQEEARFLTWRYFSRRLP
jgi:hypothetical protein